MYWGPPAPLHSPLDPFADDRYYLREEVLRAKLFERVAPDLFGGEWNGDGGDIEQRDLVLKAVEDVGTMVEHLMHKM